jgi:hypothetical protein
MMQNFSRICPELLFFHVCASIWLAIFLTTSAADTDTQEGTFTEQAKQLELSQHRRLLTVKARPNAKLSEFSTDGCSGGLSVGWDYLGSAVPKFQSIHGTQPPWEYCCIAHDRLYHAGGPSDGEEAESYAARLKADVELRACVREVGKNRTNQLSDAYGLSEKKIVAIYEQISELMFLAVRLGGVPCSSLSWRWGFGWPGCRSIEP